VPASRVFLLGPMEVRVWGAAPRHSEIPQWSLLEEIQARLGYYDTIARKRAELRYEIDGAFTRSTS